MTLTTCAGSTVRQHTGGPWLSGQEEAVTEDLGIEDLTPLPTADRRRGQGRGGWCLEVSRPIALSVQGAVQAPAS